LFSCCASARAAGFILYPKTVIDSFQVVLRVKSATRSSEETWIYVWINKSDRHVQCKFHFYVKYDIYAHTYTIFSVM
jgi:hypothetical protein